MRVIVMMFLFVSSFTVAVAAEPQAGSVAPIAAAVPRLVTFSGVVHDAAAVKAGIAGITFAIYGEQQGGAALWLETQKVGARDRL
jgi:hypothetical protein